MITLFFILGSAIAVPAGSSGALPETGQTEATVAEQNGTETVSVVVSFSDFPCH